MGLELKGTVYTFQMTDRKRVLFLIEKLLNKIGWTPPKNGHIFDAGAFTGATSAEIVSYYWDLNVHVTACDLNISEQIDSATSPNLNKVLDEHYRKSGRQLNQRLNIFTADYTQTLPLADESVDAVLLLNNFSYELYEHPEIISDPESIRKRLKELVRILKTGGSLVIWAEYIDAGSFIFTKTGERFEPAMTYSQYLDYLLSIPSPDFDHDDKQKRVEEDSVTAEKIASALSELLIEEA